MGIVNNLQLYIAIGLPTAAVLASLTVSLVQISGIREDIREIRNDIKLLTGKVAEIDTRLSLIEERIK
jgi:hypothetical protein